MDCWIIFFTFLLLDFCYFRKKGPRLKWTIYKHVSDKFKKCLFVSGILSVVCRVCHRFSLYTSLCGLLDTMFYFSIPKCLQTQKLLKIKKILLGQIIIIYILICYFYSFLNLRYSSWSSTKRIFHQTFTECMSISTYQMWLQVMKRHLILLYFLDIFIHYYWLFMSQLLYLQQTFTDYVCNQYTYTDMSTCQMWLQVVECLLVLLRFFWKFTSTSCLKCCIFTT